MAETTIRWRPVPTHPGYEVAADGDIRGPRGFVLNPMSQPKSGHLYVLTYKRTPKKLFVHRAVLLAFVGPAPAGTESRHLDGDPTNNRADNLAWGTRLENMHDKVTHGTEACGEDKPQARLTTAQVYEIRSDQRASRVVGADYGVSHTTVLAIRSRKLWRAA